MSKELAELAEIISSNNRIVGITTNSLREFLDLFPVDDEEFPYGITMVNAHASNIGEAREEHRNKEYGTRVLIGQEKDSFDLSYKLAWDKKGKTKNPLDKLGKQKILEGLDMSGCEDASVSQGKVIIKNPKIGEYSRINEDLFHTGFWSDPTDSDIDREKVKEHSVNEALIKYNNFQYRILHCRELIDRRQELTKPKSRYKYIIRWKGETAISLNSPIKVAQQLRTHLGEFGLLKQYGVGEEYKLVLMGVAR